MRLILVALASVLSMAQTTPRERALQEKLVAACCWNESIAFHRSETAAEMRAELKNMIDAGLSDQVILQRFQDKYSSRVLIEPAGGKSLLIYSVPAALTAVSAAGLIWLIRRWVRRAQAGGGA
jgi:cytochrome c-type biogenesis protein CcmH/NrfF